MRSSILLILSLGLALASCGAPTSEDAAQVALIGGSLRIADPTTDRLDDGDRLLLPALSQGLVGYDSDGKIEQGLAEAWTVTNDGLSYIFRIGPAHWNDGREVTAKDVAKILTRRIAKASRNRLSGEVFAIESIRAMTDNVVEIRLTQPQSDLLDLLAQPEFAISTKRRGWGPMRATAVGGHWLLSWAPDTLGTIATEDDLPPVALIDVAINAPETALARFGLGAVDAVLGGRYQDFPYVLASGIDTKQLIIDPAHGLFGLAFVNERGFFAASQNRAAIAKAIDRSAIVAAFGIEGWQPQLAIRPTYADTPPVIAPVLPLWSDSPITNRRIEARRTVAAWRAAGGAPVTVRIAMPDGAGSRILFASIEADLAAIGLDAKRVALFADADLRLIDQVAPSDSPLWLAHRLSCDGDVICDAQIEAKIARADATVDIVDRNALLAEIDADLTGFVPYVPLATPLRWALVAQAMKGYRGNIRARHSLAQLATKPQ